MWPTAQAVGQARGPSPGPLPRQAGEGEQKGVGPFFPGLPIRCIGTGFALGYPSPDGRLPGLQKALRHEQDFVKELLTQETRAWLNWHQD